MKQDTNCLYIRYTDSAAHLIYSSTLGRWLLFLVDLRFALTRARFIECMICIVQDHDMQTEAVRIIHLFSLVASDFERDPRCINLHATRHVWLSLLPATKFPKLRLQKQIRTRGG